MADDDAAALSDVDDDGDLAPVILPSTTSSSAAAAAASEQRIRELLAEVEEERRARRSAEDARANAESQLHRFKAFAQDVIRKRDELSRSAEEAVKRRDDALRSADDAAKKRDEAIRLKEEAASRCDALESEIATASQMLTSGLDKISGKIAAFKGFAGEGLPKSQKYSGLPAIAYGVIKRTNEIVEELLRQIELAAKSRDQALEKIEQRNYKIAIEVSQLEASIGDLRDQVSNKQAENDKLMGSVLEKDTRIVEIEGQILELQKFAEESGSKAKSFEARLDSQKPVLIEQFNYISKILERIHEMAKAVDFLGESDTEDSAESFLMWNELDIDENMKNLLEAVKSVYEFTKVALDKVKEKLVERANELTMQNAKAALLLAEKQHIISLLRTTLLSSSDEVLQVAEEGLREAGIDLRLDICNKDLLEDGREDEAYTLAGALASTAKESQIKIIELRHLVEALGAESSLLRAHLDMQGKEISQLKQHIKELELKERVANDSVEGLMMDIAIAEEEIKRWKMAAEQEAAAGRAVEQDFQTQISALRKELGEANQAVLESENKLKLKEQTAAAAMAARDAAENSLRLADSRSSRLRERIEELTRQLEESDGRSDIASWNSHSYMCWPWQWLGLNFVRYQQADTQQNSNEMELSEPLM